MIDPRKISKLPLLLKVLARSPIDFYDKLENTLEIQTDRMRRNLRNYDAITAPEALALLEKTLSAPISQFLRDSGLQEIGTKVHDRTEDLRPRAPFELGYNSDISLARLCYLVCRTLTPAIVLETGVAYGVTTAFLLQAIAQNGRGQVHSVDLAPLRQDAEDYMGFLVPQDLRGSWILHRGLD